MNINDCIVCMLDSFGINSTVNMPVMVERIRRLKKHIFYNKHDSRWYIRLDEERVQRLYNYLRGEVTCIGMIENKAIPLSHRIEYKINHGDTFVLYVKEVGETEEIARLCIKDHYKRKKIVSMEIKGSKKEVEV